MSRRWWEERGGCDIAPDIAGKNYSQSWTLGLLPMQPRIRLHARWATPPAGEGRGNKAAHERQQLALGRGMVGPMNWPAEGDNTDPVERVEVTTVQRSGLHRA